MKQIYLTTLFLSAFAFMAQAQIVGSEVFLQGDYVEVGMSQCGSYGTVNNAPSGYHPRGGGGGRLGFVADQGQDGWSVGSPDYCGDYFLPGSPEEGWAVEFNGVSYGNFTNGCSPFQIAGSITGYNATPTGTTATWQGTIGDLLISKEVIVPQNGLYFLTKVTIENTGSSPVNDVYYMRNVDPDNDQPLSSNFNTNNTIVSQPSGSTSDAVVTATGTSLGCFLGLGTTDARARVSHGGFGNRDASDIYNGIGVAQSGSASNVDQAISLAYDLGTIAPGDLVCFAYTYILDLSALSTALISTTTVDFFGNGSNITSSGSINSCLGALDVDLEIVGGSSFNWTWSPNTDINTTVGTSVTVSPSTTTVYTATGTNGCETIVQDITVVVNSTPAITYYADNDGDCLGDLTDSVSACTAPAGYVTNANDCDDTNPSIGDCSSPWQVLQKLTASDGNDDDQFGYSVSISGDYAIVGAWLTDDFAFDAGAAYIFELDAAGNWQEVQKLTASAPSTNDHFGQRVAMDGSRAIVSARLDDAGGTDAGAAYIYERDASGVWQEVQKIQASDAQAGDWFGMSVDLSGSTAIVGSIYEDTGGSNAGAAYIFERNGSGVWTEVQKLLAFGPGGPGPNDQFGHSVAVDETSGRAIVGAYTEDQGGTDAGSVYLFARLSGSWVQEGKLTASDAEADDWFGWSVSISGDRALVGSRFEDDGGTDAGAAYIYDRDAGGVWNETQKFVASDARPDDQFGNDVFLDGDRAIVGAFFADPCDADVGLAYLYEFDGSSWVEQQILTAADAGFDDRFGHTVSASGERLIIGAFGDDQGGPERGAAYILSLPAVWTGSTSTDWSTGSNWSTGSVPGASDRILIPTTPSGGNFPVVDVDLTVDDLTVEAGATMDMEPGNVLTIGAGGTVDAQGTITLQSDATGTAMLDDFSNTGSTYTGDLTVQTFVAGGLSGNNQHFISSPVTSPNVSEIGDDLTGPFGAGLPGVDGVAVTPLPTCDPNELDISSNYGNLFELDESNITTCFLERWVVRSAGNLSRGAGYSAWLAAGSTADWTGTPNSGFFIGQIPTSSGASTVYPEHFGWNLFGNPYPNALSIDEFLSVQIAFYGSPTVTSPLQYEPSGPFAGTYQAYAPGTNVAVGQGFMVQATNPGLPTIFQNSMRSTGPADWKSATGDYFEHKLEIEVHGNDFADRAEVYFNGEATADFDVLYDRTKVESDQGQPTISTGDMLAMNGLHTDDMTGRIPVAIQPGAEGSFELRFAGLETFPTGTSIYLEDAATGELIDLVVNDAYTVELTGESTGDRFHLVFEKSAAGVDELAAQGITCYSFRDVVTVDLTAAAAERSDVVITDMTGRVVTAASDLGRERTKLSVPTAAGIYTVIVTNDAGRFTKQVAIAR